MNSLKLFLFCCLTAPVSFVSAQGNVFDTYYYEFSFMGMGTAVDAESNLVGESTSFQLDNKGEATIVVMLSNLEKFDSDAVIIDVYDESEALVDNFKIEINPEWDWFKFNLTLHNEGKYYIDAYNDVDTFINTATVTITK